MSHPILLPAVGTQGVLVAQGATDIPDAVLSVVQHRGGIGFKVHGAPGTLRILPNLTVDFSGGDGPWATWSAVPVSGRDGDGNFFALINVGHTESSTYLAWSSQPPVSQSPSPQPSILSRFLSAGGSNRSAAPAQLPLQQQQPQQSTKGFFAVQSNSGPTGACCFGFRPIVAAQTVASPIQPALPVASQSASLATLAAMSSTSQSMAFSHHHHHHHHHHQHVPVAAERVIRLVDPAVLPRDEEEEDNNNDSGLRLNFSDGDTVHLVSSQLSAALPLTLTIEIVSHQHIVAVWDAHVKPLHDQHSPPNRKTATAVMIDRIKQQQQRKQQEQQQQQQGSAGSDSLMVVDDIKNEVIVVSFEVQQRKLTSASSGSGSGAAASAAVEHNLRILPNGRSIDTRGGRGPWAAFEVCRTRAGISLRCLGHPASTYLAAAPDPQQPGVLILAPVQTENPNDDPRCLWLLQPAKNNMGIFAPARWLPDFDFSCAQYQQFARDGFIIVRDAVGTAHVEGALRFLNHLLGTGPAAWAVDRSATRRLPPGSSPRYHLEHSSHRALTSVFRSSSRLMTAVQRLLGKNNAQQTTHVQIACRFPVIEEYIPEHDIGVAHAAKNASRSDWHIDGTEGTSGAPFAMLVKVALCDQPENHGNFTVFPGSHRKREVLQWWCDAINRNKAAMAASGDEAALLPAMAITHASRPQLDIDPVQVVLRPGDAVLVHPHLCHRVGTNVSSTIRYSLIIRQKLKTDDAALTRVRDDPSALLREGGPLAWFSPEVKS